MEDMICGQPLAFEAIIQRLRTLESCINERVRGS